MKNSLLFIVILLGVVSTNCNNLSPREKQIREIIDEPLKIENFETVQQANTPLSLEELKQNYEYLSVVYIQDDCSPCYPKFIAWQQKMDSIDNHENYTVLFVIKGESYGEFMTNVLDIEYVEDKYYTVMDPDGKFLENNSEIPRWIIDRSLLIGPENKIKMVGEPFATPEITKLFHETCKE